MDQACKAGEVSPKHAVCRAQHRKAQNAATPQAAPIRWAKRLDFLWEILVNHAVEGNVHGIQLRLKSIDFLRLRSAQYCADKQGTTSVQKKQGYARIVTACFSQQHTHALHPGRLRTSTTLGELFHSSLAGTVSPLTPPSGRSGASASAVSGGGWTFAITTNLKQPQHWST